MGHDVSRCYILCSFQRNVYGGYGHFSYNSVRSDQISGNSTTSSILRK